MTDDAIEQPPLVVTIVRRADRHHKVVKGHDRYYYEAEMGGQAKTLSVGPKIQAVIEANWPKHARFVFTKNSAIPCRPQE